MREGIARTMEEMIAFWTHNTMGWEYALTEVPQRPKNIKAKKNRTVACGILPPLSALSSYVLDLLVDYGHLFPLTRVDECFDRSMSARFHNLPVHMTKEGWCVTWFRPNARRRKSSLSVRTHAASAKTYNRSLTRWQFYVAKEWEKTFRALRSSYIFVAPGFTEDCHEWIFYCWILQKCRKK